MIIALLTPLMSFAFLAQAQANIPIYPISKADQPYFSDPFHVPYQESTSVYIAGTTQNYLECDGSLQSRCAARKPNDYNSSNALYQAADDVRTKICSSAGIHPFQSETEGSRSWNAVVTLHVQEKSKDCDGISGWSIIVHARPANVSTVHDQKPPNSWIGTKVLVGSFSENVDANYDGKYFQAPAGKLYLVYQKQDSGPPKKRDGVFAWPMDDPKTITPGSQPTMLLLPDEDLNSEDYVRGNHSFKLIETGNIAEVNGKFLMAYSVGAFNRKTYKLGIAYSDTFLPANGQQYRKVMKNNPQHLWDSQGEKEVFYLLQSDEIQDGWHYVGGQVLAPGVPTAARIGADGWVLTFAGYDPNDTGSQEDNKFEGSHRRPYFIKLDVKVPVNPSVKQASDTELQDWITPAHE